MSKAEVNRRFSRTGTPGDRCPRATVTGVVVPGVSFPGVVLLFAIPLLALLVAVLGCAPHTTEPALPLDCPDGCPPGTFSTTGTVETPDRWWLAFGDPALDRLVDRALTSNLDLAAVWHRLREARAVADRRSATLFPHADGFAEASSRRSDGGDDFGDGDPDGGDDRGDEELRLGLTATYEVDLWGGIRSAVEAERLRARAELADYRTAALTLSAEVARTWYQLVEARQQLAVLDQQIEANGKLLEALENRFGSGQIRGVDVLRQRQLLEATREQRLAAQARVHVLEHLLAVLLGRPPQNGIGASPGAPSPQAATLPPLPPLPATGLPAELVRRRPDVRAAYLRLQAADRDLAAAVAERYPRLSLSASAETGASDSSDLFEDWARTLAGNLLAPLFRAGELRAEVERSEAVRQQRLYLWGQATLEAWREVEDALAREARERRRVASLERQVELTEQAYRQLRTEYLYGGGNYLAVLESLTEAQRVRRDLLTARRQAVELRIALYRALAGGFEPPDRSREDS